MINPRPAFRETDFRKSSRSDPNQECVHVARRGRRVEVRDTKTVFGAPDDHRLVLTAEQFDRFLASTHTGTE